MEKNNNMTPPKVTVCISVHNTAAYLPRCLDSICSQTIQDLEIVLVNNGSSDNSLDIMNQYKEMHPDRNISIYCQEDKGLAQGRQTGINNAHGQYITFLDADDFILSDNAYEDMYETVVKNNADIVSIDTYHGDTLLQDPFTGIVESRDVLLRYLTKRDVNPMMWLRMYNRTLFEKSVLPNIYINNEDVFAFPCLLFKSKTIFFLHKPYHHYSIDNNGSYMNIMKNDPSLRMKNYERTLKARLCVPFIKSFIGSNNEDLELLRALADFECHSIIFSVLNDIAGVPYNKKVKDISDTLGYENPAKMKSFLKTNIIPNTQIKNMVKKYGLFTTYCFVKIRNIIK